MTPEQGIVGNLMRVPRGAALALALVATVGGWRGEPTGEARGAEASYSAITPDEYLKTWLVLGPIPAQEADAAPGAEDARKSGLELDLLSAGGGEAQVSPAAGETATARGGDYAWKLYDSEDDAIDLFDALPGRDFAAAYAAARIESAEDATWLVGLGSDDGVRVWLNGELVHDNPAARALAMDDDVFAVTLRKGTNQLLVKVLNEQGDWAFSLRFLSPQTQLKRLFKAASEGNLDLVKALVAAGVDVKAASPAGLTAAQVANVRGHDHVAEYLVSQGATIPATFDAGAAVLAMLQEVAAPDEPGVAVLVARDGKVLFSHGFGMADLASDAPITPTTKFRIGSVTKQFTAAAILKLQEEGRLSVDDKLSKYFPDFPRGDEVTLRHLLTHTSGIKSFTSKSNFMALAPTGATTAEMIDYFKNDPYDFDPGTKLSYNNSGYFLLGAIIEKVSGKSYNDFLQETFFQPLGMHDTGVHTATAVLKHEATGYSYVAGKPTKAVNWDMSRAGAAGALYSTVEDLMRWNEAVFGGQALSPKSLEAAFTPVTLANGDAPALSYGYGWMIGERRGLKTISHGGGLNGWLAELIRYVDQNTTVAVLHNAMPPAPGLTPSEVAAFVADAFLWQEMKPLPRYEVDPSVDPQTFADYVGRYDYMGAVMEIALDGEQLTAQLASQPRYPIFPYGGSRFFWKVVDAQIEFLRNAEGQVASARHTQGGQTFVARRLPDEKAVTVDAATLDRYVGKYEYAGLGVLTVRRDGDRLLAQMTGQPEFEIFAKGENVFFWKVVAAEITFVAGADGTIEKAIHKQSGATIEAKKIE